MTIPLIIDAADANSKEHQAALLPQAEAICQKFGFQFKASASQSGFELGLNQQGLKLYWRDEPKINPLMVDFVSGANAHRRQFGGGRGQTIAKAVGLKQGANPTVIDGTAGLGKDAFVLASLGCTVTLVERHPVVRALLYDGLLRAYQDDTIGPWMQNRMQLSEYCHICELAQINQQADVVYLDPMYPHQEKSGKKSALVKKDMRLFQYLVGGDADAVDLMEPALQLAQNRVVVKRPDYASHLSETKPNYSLAMKKNRFDVFVTI